MTDKAKLKEAIKKSGLKLNALCDKTGINRQNLYMKLKTEREFTAPEIMALSQELHLSATQRDSIFFAKEVAK